jgi:hypothetical protein
MLKFKENSAAPIIRLALPQSYVPFEKRAREARKAFASSHEYERAMFSTEHDQHLTSVVYVQATELV